jgi:hypothetical protein
LKLDRTNFQRLAQARIDDAKALLDNQRWDGAYYLAGYSVECALKSCIIARLLVTDEFPEKGFSNSCYTHELSKLATIAGLEEKLTTDPVVRENWIIVESWKETFRYELRDTNEAKREAEALYRAVTDPAHGVLPWIQSLHW